MSKTLVCPSCHSGEELRSIETAQIAYPATFTAAGPEYTGESYEVFDEGTTFGDLIDCSNCDSLDMTLGDLIEEEEEEH